MRIIWSIFMLLGIQLLKVNSQDIVPRFPISYTNSKDVNCKKDSLLLEQGLNEKILWAMQMWDSSVKSGVGIVSGTLLQYGDFDECLSVKEPIKAKYCLLTVTLLKPAKYNSTDPYTIDYNPFVPVWEKLNDRGIVSKQKNNVINWALCVPSSCKENDMLVSLNEYMKNQNLTSEFTLSLTNDACTRIDDNLFTFGDFVFCFGVGVYLIFVVLITIHDCLYFETLEERPGNILQCFSLRRSLQSLSKPYAPINGYNMNILRGFHIFPIIFITLGHRYSMFVIGGMSNYHFVEKTFKYTEFSMWSSRISLTVDCFFTISGFMVGALVPFYFVNKKTIIFDVVLNRYIRLMPSFLFVVLFHATILDNTGDGPIWNSVIHPEKQFCIENWWINLLFIGNYINSDRNCILQSWYIYCDIQLFVITAIIFYIAKGHPFILKCLISALIVATMIGSFYAVYTWNFTAFILHYKRVMDNIRGDDYFNKFYTKTHFRAPPYLFGVIAGYIFYLRKPNKISKGETNSLLFGGFIIIFIVYTSGYLFSDPSNYRYGLPAALYASLSNVLWAVGLLMMMISLLIGSTNMITKLFSCNLIIPLSKLVYNIYLVHLTLQTHTAATRRTPGYISPMNWFSSTISDLVISTFLAFLLYLFIETPVRYSFTYLKYKVNKPKEEIPV